MKIVPVAYSSAGIDPESGTLLRGLKIACFIAQIHGKTSLSKSTVGSMLLKSLRLKDAVNNPQAFEHVAGAINDTKRALLVEGVEYVKMDGSVYEMH